MPPVHDLIDAWEKHHGFSQPLLKCTWWLIIMGYYWTMINPIMMLIDGICWPLWTPLIDVNFGEQETNWTCAQWWGKIECNWDDIMSWTDKNRCLAWVTVSWSPTRPYSEFELLLGTRHSWVRSRSLLGKAAVKLFRPSLKNSFLFPD